jgi:hypothetical protein
MARAIKLAARPLVAVALALVAVCVPRAIEAQRGSAGRAVRIAVGEIAARDGGPRAAQALSRALVEALEAQPSIHVAPPPRADLVVRGSLVRLDRHAVEGGVEVRCEVSLIVAEARGGSIRAMLRGRGGARGGGDPARLSNAALRAAVRGALRPLSTQSAALARR